MRRRLTLGTVAVVALGLVVSGLLALVLTGLAARQQTRRELASQADEIAAQADDLATFRALAAASKALRLDGLARVTFTRSGAVEGQLPDGVRATDVQPARLAEGQTITGVRNGHVFAAARVEPPAAVQRLRPFSLTAVVVTRKADAGLAPGFRWFVLSALVTLAIAAIVGDRLGRRIAAPIEHVEEATRRIAAGDLGARVPDPGAGDPELQSLARSVNGMADSLARSRGLERQFLLAVSHDLRTPLTSIRGFAEAIADGAAPDHEKAAEVIAAESRRLERLVADLLELAKLDARRFSLDVRRTDVGEVVAVTAEGFRPELDELGVALHVDLPAEPLHASADPDRLAQAVANLVENALKFATSAITVATTATTDEVLIVVDDDGPGIAPDDLPHVFERLYTSSRHPARKAGTGLGLAIVAELVAAMGGRVDASTPGPTGTRMTIRLRRWTGLVGPAAT
ncbi:MAG TPA: HAMP domain-containing sensor histidine kinase [Acidimicrobiales bacterium]|nr:HAMP domain-containing sensor histidine kinase [Acidimicrobiales bacterium]